VEHRWAALSEWAILNRMQLKKGPGLEAPAPLTKFDPQAKALVSLFDDDTNIIRVQMRPTVMTALEMPVVWHVLLRKLSTTWPPTGFRPVSRAKTVLDWLPLQEMRAMAPGERFVFYAAEANAARLLARSSSRALLPPDIAMLLIDQTLILDFSTRPFDPLELQRIDALAEQLVAHLPSQTATARGREE
jgi:hypothetical protein